MSNITISNLTFGFGDTSLFKNVNLTIDSHWKLGLIGRNGRGKTTLLKLILGEYEFEGSIHSPLTFEYFPYEVVDPDDMAINVIDSIYPDMELWKVVRESNLLDLSDDVLYQPYSTLSSGQQTRLKLALLFSRENCFPLIDEPTNHLDVAGRERVCKYLASKEGFILVSHDRCFLDGCIDHVLSINKCNIELQQGNFSSWQRNFETVQESELLENKRLKKEISRLSDAAIEKQQWSDAVEKTKCGTRISGLRPDKGHMGHMAAKMAKKSKVVMNHMEQEIESKEMLLKNLERAPDLVIPAIKGRFKQLLSLEDVNYSYDDKSILNGVNLAMTFGERVAISGKNGCGKSTLLKLICDHFSPTSGTITLSPSLTISYLPQDVSALAGSLDNFISSSGCDGTMFKTFLRKLGFNRSTFEIPLDKYSQGQKKKVALAASLCTPAHLYIWDEPLNYIDLMSRIQIENTILASACTMLIVEHDKTFLSKVATRTIEL